MIIQLKQGKLNQPIICRNNSFSKQNYKTNNSFKILQSQESSYNFTFQVMSLSLTLITFCQAVLPRSSHFRLVSLPLSLSLYFVRSGSVFFLCFVLFGLNFSEILWVVNIFYWVFSRQCLGIMIFLLSSGGLCKQQYFSHFVFLKGLKEAENNVRQLTS